MFGAALECGAYAFIADVIDVVVEVTVTDKGDDVFAKDVGVVSAVVAIEDESVVVFAVDDLVSADAFVVVVAAVVVAVVVTAVVVAAVVAVEKGNMEAIAAISGEDNAIGVSASTTGDGKGESIIVADSENLFPEDVLTAAEA